MHIAVEKVQQFLRKVRCLLAFWPLFHEPPPFNPASL
jgi:hypothetical protein